MFFGTVAKVEDSFALGITLQQAIKNNRGVDETDE